MTDIAHGCAFLFRDFEQYDEKAAAKNLTAKQTALLAQLRQTLAELPQWQPELLQAAVQGVAEALGLKFGKVGPPLRVAVTGGAASPSIDITLALLGRDKTLARIDRALSFINALG